MKKEIIEVPDGYEIKQVAEGKWELVRTEITLDDILTSTRIATISTQLGDMDMSFSNLDQLKRMDAMLKLMCVADYLNNGWQPKWNEREGKWHIEWYEGDVNKLIVDMSCTYSTCGEIVFNSEELARKAIELCGEQLIKTALGII